MITDEKLQMMLDVRIWRELFPDFVSKRISHDVISVLASPEGRMGLIETIRRGEYHVAPPRVVMIPKKNGGYRQVYVLNDLDRCVMAVINTVYTRLYGARIHPNCKSYQKGLSVPATLHGLQSKLGIGGYKVDLSKYFDSVPHWKINDMLHSMDTSSPVDKVLWEFYNTDLIEVDGKIVPHFKSLGQGCAFSALLSNLALAEIDAKMSDQCEVFLRYSDDILLLDQQADEQLAVLQKELQKLELTTNPKKLIKIDSDSEFIFLGGKVCKDSVHMSEESYSKMKQSIRRICKRYHKRGNRSVQRRAVRALQAYLFGGKQYTVLEYFCFLCTDESDIERLDRYCRDELKAIYTGKHNHTTNEHKTSNSVLEELGWVSLVHLYRLYKYSSDVYDAKVKSIKCRAWNPKHVESVYGLQLTEDTCVNLATGIVKQFGLFYKVERKERQSVFECIEDLWPLARQSTRMTALNTSPPTEPPLSWDEVLEHDHALLTIEMLICTTKWDFSQYFLQSKKYPDLVIFKDWAAV